ncbi:MAG: hypothetical protein U0992_15610 [Planctomycetaceae bacterium]
MRFDADRILWIGVGADGSKCDNWNQLKAIAIYERAGTKGIPRYNFSRLEDPAVWIAEVGRRITRLRASWASQRHQSPRPTSADAAPIVVEPPKSAVQRLTSSNATDIIAGRVVQRWISGLESSKTRGAPSDPTVRVEMLVPGEANQLIDLLQRHDIAATLVPTITQVRHAEREDYEVLNTGAVEFASSDYARVSDLLRLLVAET